MSTLSRDAFVGGALNKEDLLEILQMEIETLAGKSKSQEGVARDDLKPLVKAISDVRAVGLGNDPALKKAVEFQMRITRQLVVQQDVKTALVNKNLEEMKAAAERAKSLQLKTRQSKELEQEIVRVQKEMLKRVSEENQKLRKLQTPTQPAAPTASDDTKSQGSGGGAGGAGAGASSGRFFFKKQTSSSSHAPPMSPDDHQLTDAQRERRPSSMGFAKKLFGGGKTSSSPSSSSSQPHPAAATAHPPQPLPEDDALLEGPSHQQPPSVFQELHRQAQYDLLVEAMQRVKIVLDATTPATGGGPGSILKAAGDDVELVTGDHSTVHIWLGEFHGVVRSAASTVTIANARTVLVGEIDSKHSDNKWEIRMFAGETAHVAAASEDDLRQHIARLEMELKQARENGGPRGAGAEVQALLEQRSESIAFERREEAKQETDRRRQRQLSETGLEGEEKDLSKQVAQLDLVPVDVMSVKELKAYVLDKGGSIAGVTEKDELVKLAEQLRQQQSSKKAPSTPVSSPKQQQTPTKSPTAAADSSDEEEADAASSTLQWKDHEQYGKYFRMLKVGLDLDAVKHKVKQDGLDAAVMDLAPDSLVSAKPKSPQEVLEPYLKMIRFGVPRAVVEYKMRSKGLDPGLLDGGEGGGEDGDGDDEEEVDIPRLAHKICEDERFIPFLKMLGFGVPKDAVKIKMQTKGLDGDVLDMDPNDLAPVDGTNVQRKKKKQKKSNLPRKKKDDGHQWKKLFWQPIRLEKGKDASTMWTRAGSEFELVDSEKHDVKQWFALKVSSAADQQAAAAAAAAARANKPETLQVLEGARAQNVSILLSKFRLQSADLKRMIYTLKVADELDLTNDDVKSILSMLPTSEEAEKLNKVPADKRDTLGAAEKHFVALLEVPRFRPRIACFLFKLQFEEIKRDLEFDLHTLGRAVLELLDSSKLRRLFSVILALGNQLNSMGGLLNEEEDGFVPVRAFKLSASLSKIKLSKAHAGNGGAGGGGGGGGGAQRNMLNMLETVLYKRQRGVLEYVLGEVDGVRAASTVVLSNVKAQVKGLAMGVKELENEVNHGEGVRADGEQSKHITPQDEVFFNAVDVFYQKARREVHELSVQMAQVEANFADLVAYVREDEDTTPEVLFKALVQFFDEVHVAHEENTVARLKAEKLLGNKPVEEEEKVQVPVVVEEEPEEEEEDNLEDGFGAVETTLDLIAPEASRASVDDVLETVEEEEEEEEVVVLMKEEEEAVFPVQEEEPVAALVEEEPVVVLVEEEELMQEEEPVTTTFDPFAAAAPSPTLAAVAEEEEEEEDDFFAVEEIVDTVEPLRLNNNSLLADHTVTDEDLKRA